MKENFLGKHATSVTNVPQAYAKQIKAESLSAQEKIKDQYANQTVNANKECSVTLKYANLQGDRMSSA